ncbi:MAG: hypothetical protein CVU88_06640, partial [Firmicutes bacterium HGW-Firmicutes-13]
MKCERICFNCNYFMSDIQDFDTSYGICLKGGDFDPYLDEIYENSDFSSCKSLYNQNRFSGEQIGCIDYEEVEILEEFTEKLDEEEIENLILQKAMQYQNVDSIIENLYSDDHKEEAISSLSAYITLRNEQAFEGLLKYFKNLSAAASIEEVHHHVKIITALQLSPSKEKLIEVFINELYKTLSNNTTRQIYNEIFRFFN